MDDPDYEIGFKKPPAAARFQKGQSGNPAGRPKKPEDVLKIWGRLLNEKMAIPENGKARKVTRLEAVIARLFHRAMKGDARAYAVYMRQRKKITRLQEQPPPWVLAKEPGSAGAPVPTANSAGESNE